MSQNCIILKIFKYSTDNHRLRVETGRWDETLLNKRYGMIFIKE